MLAARGKIVISGLLREIVRRIRTATQASRCPNIRDVLQSSQFVRTQASKLHLVLRCVQPFCRAKWSVTRVLHGDPNRRNVSHNRRHGQGVEFGPRTSLQAVDTSLIQEKYFVNALFLALLAKSLTALVIPIKFN